MKAKDGTTVLGLAESGKHLSVIDAIRKRLGGKGGVEQVPVFAGERFTNSIGMVFHKIPAGSFMMGGAGKYDGKPMHEVTLSSLFLAKTETTIAQWVMVLEWAEKNGYQFDRRDDDLLCVLYDRNCPMFDVSWYDVVKWCNAASEMEKKKTCYLVNGSVYKKSKNKDVACVWGVNGYRLPTEAAWEYACRAESTTAFYWGETFDRGDEYCWWCGNSKYKMHPAGGRKPNAWGLHDMVGNVLEWCWDWHDNYTATAVRDPKGKLSGISRVMRGGTFASDINDGLRSAIRANSIPDNDFNGFGFRLAASER